MVVRNRTAMTGRQAHENQRLTFPHGRNPVSHGIFDDLGPRGLVRGAAAVIQRESINALLSQIALFPLVHTMSSSLQLLEGGSAYLHRRKNCQRIDSHFHGRHGNPAKTKTFRIVRRVIARSSSGCVDGGVFELLRKHIWVFGCEGEPDVSSAGWVRDGSRQDVEEGRK